MYNPVHQICGETALLSKGVPRWRNFQVFTKTSGLDQTIKFDKINKVYLRRSKAKRSIRDLGNLAKQTL